MPNLLIQGLEMPKGDLALWLTVHKDGTVEYLDNNKYEGYKTLRNAAVTVPPLVLIDADKLEKAEEWRKHGIINQETVNAASTIIPASIEDFPAADVRPAELAVWAPVRRKDGSIDFRCTACRKFSFHNGEFRKKYRFCPGCGAQIRQTKDVNE